MWVDISRVRVEGRDMKASEDMMDLDGWPRRGVIYFSR